MLTLEELEARVAKLEHTVYVEGVSKMKPGICTAELYDYKIPLQYNVSTSPATGINEFYNPGTGINEAGSNLPDDYDDTISKINSIDKYKLPDDITTNDFGEKKYFHIHKDIWCPDYSKLFEWNKDELMKVAELDTSKVYVFQIKVGNMPKDTLMTYMKNLKEACDKTGIKTILIPIVEDGIGEISITELSKYIEEEKKKQSEETSLEENGVPQF